MMPCDMIDVLKHGRTYNEYISNRDSQHTIRNMVFANSLILLLSAALALSINDKVESPKESLTVSKAHDAVPKGSLDAKGPAADIDLTRAPSQDIDLKAKHNIFPPFLPYPIGFPFGNDNHRFCRGVLKADKEWICEEFPQQCKCLEADQCKCDEHPVDQSGKKCFPCHYPRHLCLCYP